MNKVLILSCGTGGGHNSAALAIQEKLKEKGVQAEFVEYLSIINPKIKDRINHLYIKSTKGNGKVFKVVYHLGELYQRTKLKSPVYQLNSLNKKKLYEYIKNNQYNYIVTTHLFAAQALTAIKKEYPIHFIAVATDYVSIPFWEETNPDYFVIPNKELEEDFKKKKIEAEKLLPLGIPVAKDYCQDYKKEICKEELNLEKNKKYILISTGSMGFGKVKEMVKELIKQMKEVVFIVSCGHNTKLYEDLKSTYQQNEHIIVIPYTNRLSQYMKCSEIILSKPGGLTSTEIATLNKPLIHTMPIPGCENYNADFFSKRNMSIKCDTIQEIIDSTKELFNNQELQEKMIKNQTKYIHKTACDEIVDVMIKNMKEGENHEGNDERRYGIRRK